MIHDVCPVTDLHPVAPNMLVLSFRSEAIAAQTRPGQFDNIKVNEWTVPLLRRPFSVYHVSGGDVQVIFNVIGMGTRILSIKRVGDTIDVLGPLGCSYGLIGDYDTAVLVAGGLGVAPLPMLTSALRDTRKKLVTLLGARTGDQIVPTHLENVHLATDDGSTGHHGTVVDLLRSQLERNSYVRPKIFGCGPNVMLNTLASVAAEFDIPCEVSLESAMACGIGICQGCPVETIDGEKKYALICKEGTVFDTRRIKILAHG